MADVILQHCCYFIITGTPQRSYASLFDTDVVTLNFTRLAHTGCYVRRIFEYSCVLLLTAHCTIPTHSMILFLSASRSVVTLNYNQNLQIITLLVT
jgi:hypothetical protein